MGTALVRSVVINYFRLELKGILRENNRKKSVLRQYLADNLFHVLCKSKLKKITGTELQPF